MNNTKIKRHYSEAIKTNHEQESYYEGRIDAMADTIIYQNSVIQETSVKMSALEKEKNNLAQVVQSQKEQIKKMLHSDNPSGGIYPPGSDEW